MRKLLTLASILTVLLAGCTKVVPVERNSNDSARIADLEKRVAALEVQQGK